MLDEVGVIGGGVAICTAGEDEGDDEEDGAVDISVQAELSGAVDDLYSHRDNTDLDSLLVPASRFCVNHWNS